MSFTFPRMTRLALIPVLILALFSGPCTPDDTSPWKPAASDSRENHAPR